MKHWKLWLLFTGFLVGLTAGQVVLDYNAAIGCTLIFIGALCALKIVHGSKLFA